MDRASRHQTAWSRRWTTGVALAAAATLAVIATIHASLDASDHAGARAFPNASGTIGVVGLNATAADNPFFQELGTNGRSCASCHRRN